MKKRRAATAAAAITLSMAIGTTAFALPSDIGGHWAQPTIVQWTSKGYISGYPDGTFKPDNSITRAEFVVLVNKSMGYTKKGSAYFTDLSSSHWAYDEIMKGVSAGYISGDASGTFRPDDPVSRQEAAVMISKILDLGTDPASAAKFVDYRYIPAWAVGYVGAVTKAGIMTGYPDGDFKADRVLTRAEAVVSLNGAVNYDGKTDDNKEDYTLEATILKDKTITGDLIISSDLKTRSVSLDNVTVKGTVIVNGGGTITANDCDINKLEINSADATFVAKGDTSVKSARFEEAGSIEGKGYEKVTVDEELSDRIVIDAEIDEFILDAETDIRLLSNTVIKNFTATENADRATVSFSKAEIEDMDIYDKIKITGSGDIDTMTVYVSGVTSTIKPDSLKQKDGADKPDYVSGGSSGDIEYGGSSSRYDDYTITKDGKTVRGGKYDDVTIKADDVSLEGTTIYGDLTIHKDVKNGDATLEDVTVRGNVYVYGGGDSSVIFDGCDIKGDIIANKEVTSQAVNLVFRNSTDVDGKIRVRNNTIITSSYKLDSIVMEDTDADLELKANVAYLEFTKKGELSIDNHTVDSLTIGGSAKNSEIAMKNGAVIKTLTAKSDVTVSGKGTIEKTSGSGDITKGNEITVGVAVTGVTLDKNEASITVGDKVTLTATVTPDNAANKKVTWDSSNEEVATVDENGVVTGLKAGDATITVKTEDGGKTAECKVTVTEKTVAVTGVTLDKTSAEITVGGTVTLKATVAPDNAANKKVTWDSSNEEVATVDENGVVTGLKAGDATITVKTEDGGKTAECKIKVTEKTVAVTGVTIDDTATVKETEKVTLTATISPETATNKNVTWESSNEEVATVENGVVTGVKAGTATITVTTEDGNFKDTCALTVEAKEPETVPVKGVSLDKTELTLEVGKSETLTATLNPENATVKDMTWSGGDQYVGATPDGWNKATITAKKVTEEPVVITVTTEDGSYTATCTVTVTAADKSALAAAISEAKSAKTGVVVSDKGDGTDVDKETYWVTQDVMTTLEEAITNAETVYSTENATAEAINEALTKLKTATEKFVKKEGTKEEVTGLTLNKDKIELTVGGSETLTATVTPANATDTTVTWESNNPSVADVNNGTITAKAEGTTTITAKAGGEAATCEVKVNPQTVPVSGITLNKTTLLLTAGGSGETLTATVTPANATDTTVTWESSNPSVATVSNGVVTPVSVGTAKITAKAGEKTAYCDVTVSSATTPSVQITGVTGEITAGSQVNLTATVTGATDPANITYLWTISFGDTQKTNMITGNGNTAIVNTTGAEGGQYTVTLTVTINGQQYIATQVINIK